MVADGLVAIEVEPAEEDAVPLGSIAFEPGSAALPAAALPVLAEWLAVADAHSDRVRVVGEAPAPGLALDRARTVGLALMRGGLSAARLELSHAEGGGDRARLFLAAQTPQ
jgi:hypothetical protein